MACISKLAIAIAYDCDSGATGIESAFIINKADIGSYRVASDTGVVLDLTLVAGAKAYKIDTVKRSLVVSTSLKINDGAPNAYTHSASIIQTETVGDGPRNALNAFANGSFVIAAKWSNRAARMIYGLYFGMSATGVENNSHDNGGWTTITLETPESVIGEDALRLSDALYDSLLAAAEG